MAHHIEEPTVTRDNHDPDGKRISHPAFGQIQVSRVSGHTTLYGSDFQHNHYVSISIHQSVLRRNLSRDWPLAEGELLRLDMSEAQWAAFVSSFNIGAGVQCTLTRVAGKGMPGLPHRDEAQEYVSEGAERLERANDDLAKLILDIESGVFGKMSVKTTDELRSRLRGVQRNLSSNLQFVAQSFGEHLEERMSKAKTEFSAWATHQIMRLGLEKLAPFELSREKTPQIEHKEQGE